jgi:hypothetical protein
MSLTISAETTFLLDMVNPTTTEISTASFYDWASKAPSPFDWSNTPNNTLAESGGFLTITYVDNATGGTYNITQANGLSEELINGTYYTIQAQLKATGTVNARVWDGAAYQGTQGLTGSYVVYTFNITKNAAGSAFFTFASMDGSDDVSIGYIKVYKNI